MRDHRDPLPMSKSTVVGVTTHLPICRHMDDVKILERSLEPRRANRKTQNQHLIYGLLGIEGNFGDI